MKSPWDGFTPEGGKLRLAEALFETARYSIHCPSCPTTPGAPGHIKDQAGKSPKDGLNRRMWKCRRSNTKQATKDCPRKTCTDYIDLARHDLPAERFTDIVRQVLQRGLLPAQEPVIASYLNPQPPTIGLPPPSCPTTVLQEDPTPIRPQDPPPDLPHIDPIPKNTPASASPLQPGSPKILPAPLPLLPTAAVPGRDPARSFPWPATKRAASEEPGGHLSKQQQHHRARHQRTDRTRTPGASTPGELHRLLERGQQQAEAIHHTITSIAIAITQGARPSDQPSEPGPSSIPTQADPVREDLASPVAPTASAPHRGSSSPLHRLSEKPLIRRTALGLLGASAINSAPARPREEWPQDGASLATRFQQATRPEDRRRIRTRVKELGVKKAFEAHLTKIQSQHRLRGKRSTRAPDPSTTHRPLPFTPTPKAPTGETPPASSSA